MVVPENYISISLSEFRSILNTGDGDFLNFINADFGYFSPNASRFSSSSNRTIEYFPGDSRDLTPSAILIHSRLKFLTFRINSNSSDFELGVRNSGFLTLEKIA